MERWVRERAAENGIKLCTCSLFCPSGFAIAPSCLLVLFFVLVCLFVSFYLLVCFWKQLGFYRLSFSFFTCSLRIGCKNRLNLYYWSDSYTERNALGSSVVLLYRMVVEIWGRKTVSIFLSTPSGSRSNFPIHVIIFILCYFCYFFPF